MWLPVPEAHKDFSKLSAVTVSKRCRVIGYLLGNYLVYLAIYWKDAEEIGTWRFRR